MKILKASVESDYEDTAKKLNEFADKYHLDEVNFFNIVTLDVSDKTKLDMIEVLKNNLIDYALLMFQVVDER